MADTKSNNLSDNNDLEQNVVIQKRDTGWAWVIVCSAFIINIITDGCSFSFGVLYTHLLEEFGETRSATAWTGSLLASAPMLCGPIASFITLKIGYRKATIIGGIIATSGYVASAYVNSIDAICVTLGCITGIGVSLPYLNSIIVVTSYFEKKRTIATGITQSGAGIGTLIFAPVYEFLIEKYGWRGALMIMGGIVFNIVACGAVFRKIEKHISIDESIKVESMEFIRKNKEHDEKDINVEPNIKEEMEMDLEIESEHFIEKRDKTKYKCIGSIHKKLQILSDTRFLIFALSMVIVYFFYDVPYDFTIDRLKGFGIEEQKSTFIVACIGLFHVIGNIGFGFLGNKTQTHRIYLYSCSLFIWGLTVFIIPFFTDYLSNMILGGVFGFMSACQEAIHASIMIDILGEEKMTNAYGILMFLEGLANLFGPPFAGWLYDLSGSYNNTYFSSGSCIASAGLLVLISRICIRRKPTEFDDQSA